MSMLVLGRAGSTLTIVPYPTLDTLIQRFAGRHIGFGYFAIRVGADDIYLDREDADVAEAVGAALDQDGQRRIYSVAMWADEFAAALRAEAAGLDIEIRDCDPWKEVHRADPAPDAGGGSAAASGLLLPAA